MSKCSKCGSSDDLIPASGGVVCGACYDADADRRIELFYLGYEDHKRGEARPSHYPERAEGWDARDAEARIRVVMPRRPEGYYHAPIGTFD